jgi:aspartyl-tRNA synthetase
MMRIEILGGWKRTHYCGEVTSKQIGKEVVLMGWIRRSRDHGGVIFIDLWDRTGIVQIVFSPQTSKDIHSRGERLRSEFVIAIKGKVRKRPKDTENPSMPTGKIEVVVNEVKVLNESETPPLELDSEQIGEEVRLKYRYVDLRKDKMQKNLLLRHKVTQEARKFLSGKGFLEIETPFLARSTPEGARDYLVPSRLSPYSFYALTQSPQLFKQLLMVGGVDKYFQIVRCFRDEDTRKDRQPEFTQIDIEMSFAEKEDVMSVSEGLMKNIFGVLGKKLKIPFPKITYDEAISRYGVDNPDTRFGLELKDITDIAKKTDLKIFKQVIEKGGIAKAINVPSGGEKLSLKVRNNLIEYVQGFGAGGLAWIEVKSDSMHSPIAKYFKEELLKKLKSKMGSKAGDLILIVADNKQITNTTLGGLRVKLAGELGLIKKDSPFSILWVTDYPLLEYSTEEKRWQFSHHPFTAPLDEDIKYLEKEPKKVKSKAYDLVLNGTEIASGSIRIHNRVLQEKVFKAVGIDKKEAKEKFGFLLEAFKYGAPPHGGIAFGFDRLLAIMSGETTIRDVIAFPKTQKGICLTTKAPSSVNEKQLKELHIKLDR